MNNYLSYSIEQLFELSLEELENPLKANDLYLPINGYLRYEKVNESKKEKDLQFLKSSFDSKYTPQVKYRCQTEDKTNAEPLKTRSEVEYAEFIKRNFGSSLPTVHEIRAHPEFGKLPYKPLLINGIRQSYGENKSIEQKRLEKKNKEYLDNEDADLFNDFENKKASAIIKIIHKGINDQKKKQNTKRRKFHFHERLSIFARDGNKCLCCGQDSFMNLTVDHIVPLCKGGTNDFDNLQTLCDVCNHAKGMKVRDYRQASKLVVQ